MAEVQEFPIIVTTLEGIVEIDFVGGKMTITVTGLPYGVILKVVRRDSEDKPRSMARLYGAPKESGATIEEEGEG